MPDGIQSPVPFSVKLKELGSWVRETIIITANEIADAVMDDIPENLPDPVLPGVAYNSLTDTDSSVRADFGYFGHHVHSSSDTGSTQSCDFDELDLDYLNSPHDFPTTLDRVSLISRIHTLYTSGFGLGSTLFLNENCKLIPKSFEEIDDMVVVVDRGTTEEVDDSGWVKL